MSTLNESHNAEAIQRAIEVLSQTIYKLDDYDYGSALIMMGVSRQLLDDVQDRLEQSLKVQHTLRSVLRS